MKTTTAIMFMPRLKRPVSTIDSGITSRGNCVLRTIPSRAATEKVATFVVSWKKPKKTMLKSRNIG